MKILTLTEYEIDTLLVGLDAVMDACSDQDDMDYVMELRGKLEDAKNPQVLCEQTN